MEHGASSIETGGGARERDCVFVFTALLERTVRAVRHASPDFPFPVARATRPFRFAALDLVSTTTSGRARAPVDTQTHRHSHVSPGCRPRLPFAAAAAAAARRAACHCDCDCDSSGPHFGHASTLLACLARVVGRRRSTVDCIVGMQSRPIEPAAWRHGGMAASLHRSSLHPSIPLCALAPRPPGLPCSPSERLRPLPLCTPRRLGRRPVSLVTGLTRPDRPDLT
jgi:hypothetical protein